jgi:carbon-monoxide dehydrogenase medium subunit
MTPERFDYFAPRSLEEALDLLARHGEHAKLLAGGQSLLAAMKLRLASPKVLIDLNRIDTLQGIRDEGDWLSIGAMTRYADVSDAEVVRRKCPLLPQTVAVVADVQIRNRGTVGGSIAHADPAGDLPAAVLALEAELKAVSPRGERWISATDFFVTTYTTRLGPDEILTDIRVPSLDNRRSVYLKAARRPSDFAMVGVAAVAAVNSDRTCKNLAVAITGVADHPYRAREVERALRGRAPDASGLQAAAATATDGVAVAADVHASSPYRAHLTRVYVERALNAVLTDAS